MFDNTNSVRNQDRMTLRERRREDTRAEILGAAWELSRQSGLAGLSLRELAARVGMRAPSLYSYFDSKDAIYDAMFRQGYEELGRAMAESEREGTIDRAGVKRATHRFFEFCTEDPQRYQLMFQRTIPGFEPSPGSYGVSQEQLESLRRAFVEVGIEGDEALDMWTALLTGLTDQQISNDPGGDRWARLLDEAVDMYLDHYGALPRQRGGSDDHDRDRCPLDPTDLSSGSGRPR